ncbi:DNA-directed RNA polymerase subunit beta' [Erythrobacter crassostreae]|uniref:DNA-directed RNA polymerase subunit beta n=1 Tax=Erythrobacter crassostreae TaxID=2828328 RepID=A0A9X1F1J5_9SPHN|nr:DNA-directed RNA polymerase subunit beta' [Erythrobacter crassostrea]MBV7258321.1 DNA-directed RNA polymerase subunit beta' [Erythrobacter crassostrea]
MRESAHSASAAAWIKELQRPKQTNALSPIAARFVYSLRLIALHERAKEDPLPELVVRLGSVEVAAKALALAQAVSNIWPDPIHVSRFCCHFLSYDETAIGALLDSASQCDRTGFENAIAGLIRPDRMHRLWDKTLALIAAEARAL